MGVLLKSVSELLPSNIKRRCVELLLLFGLLLYLAASSVLPDVPLCPFHALGYPCPTCGTTRSLWSILHGELGAAWQYNPIGFVVLLVFLRRIVVLVSIDNRLTRVLDHNWVGAMLLGSCLVLGFLRILAVL